MEKRLKEIAEIIFCLVSKEINEKNYKTITPINLLDNNTIQSIDLENRLKVDETTRIKEGDIIIKRVCPSFINYISDIKENIYAGGNLIIVRAVSVEPKYLACILNRAIKITTQALTGAAMPAIGRRDLEEIQVPVFPIEKQIAIGEIWYNSIELYKLRSRINNLEFLKRTHILNELTAGGKENV